MPVPTDIRTQNQVVNSGNLMKYMVGKFEDPITKEPVRVFLHEAVWVLEHGTLIPEGKLVAHEDGDPFNNDASNLQLVDENKEYGDLHESKIFHENENNMEIIKGHFPDIYQKLSN